MINPASLIGALIGFALGIFLLRSPLLGIIFALIGSSVGSGIGLRVFRGQQKEEGGSSWFAGWGNTTGSVFMETLFSMLGRLAAADGRVSAEEERVFRTVVTNELRITDPQSIASAMEIFHRAASSGVPMRDYARRAAASFANRPQLLEMMLIIMVRISAAEGGLHREEDAMMRETASLFGYSNMHYESIKARYAASGRGWSGAAHQQTGAPSSDYQILGVAETAGESEIRRAYRKKASEYHPDKIAAKGLPKDFTELANSKFQEIQQAWERIRKVRGY